MGPSRIAVLARRNSPDTHRRWVVSVHAAPVTSSTVVVAVDAGKTSVALSVTDGRRDRLFGPVEFVMTRSALTATVGQVLGVLPCAHVPVKVGVEACGHYHQPLVAPAAWPAGSGGAGVEPGACGGAAAGAGPAAGQDRRVRPGRDHRDAAGRARHPGHRPDPGGRPVDGVDRAPHPPGRDPHGHDEPAAGPVGPRLPGADAGAAGRARHQGRPPWSPPSWSIRPGWPRWARPGSCGSPPPGACRSGRRWPSGWSRLPTTRCPPPMPRLPGRSWPPTCGCCASSTGRSPRPSSSWRCCCRTTRSGR